MPYYCKLTVNIDINQRDNDSDDMLLVMMSIHAGRCDCHAMSIDTVLTSPGHKPHSSIMCKTQDSLLAHQHLTKH